MQKKHLLAICMLLLSGSVMAQEQAPKKKRIGYEQMTQIMTKDLKLDEKQQKKYDKAIGKILSSEQMDGYQQIKPKFASQLRVREFLLGGPQDGLTNTHSS